MLHNLLASRAPSRAIPIGPLLTSLASLVSYSSLTGFEYILCALLLFRPAESSAVLDIARLKEVFVTYDQHEDDQD